MQFSLQFYIRMLATLIVLLVTLIFFKSIAINTTLFLIIMCGVAFFYVGSKYNRNNSDLDELFKLSLIIPIIIFIIGFLYILAQVTLFLFLVTVISFCIIQDGLYRLTSQIFGDREFDFDDLYENIWYGIGMFGIIVPAFIAFDYNNYLSLSDSSVLDYTRTRLSASHFNIQDIANIGNYLDNSWIDLKNFARKTTVDMMQGILKSTFIGVGVFNIIDSAMKYFAFR